MRLSMFKRAFTLAEVLITLGIIGVVSAMTLPTLMNKTQNKELHAQFQKVYSELNQVAMKFKVDEEIAAPEYCRRYGKTKFIERISKYFKNVKIVDDTYYGSKDEEGNALSTKYTIHTMNGTAQRIPLCDMDGFRAEIGGRQNATLLHACRKRPEQAASRNSKTTQSPARHRKHRRMSACWNAQFAIP